MMRRYLVLVIFLLFQSIIYAQTALVEEINRIFNQSSYTHAQIGIAIIDNTTGRVLFEKNNEQFFIPASVLKMVTTATALEILGPNYRFKTRLYYSGKIENGTLHGDLIIIGGGDPALGSSYFNNHYLTPHFLKTWAGLVSEAGIKKVDGRIVIDNTLYGNEKLPPSWTWEDMGNYYGAAPAHLHGTII